MSPEEFAQACRAIVAESTGDEAHRRLDAMVTLLLTELGFGKGMQIFLDAVRPYHGEAA